MTKILAVGRGYIGKALNHYKEFELISHSKFLEDPGVVLGYEGVVNTAGIIGHRNCDAAGYEAVMKANVAFPLRVQAACLKANVRCIQLTTVGISELQVAPTADIRFRVNMPVYPHNLYCASKILLEASLRNKLCILLRLPWVVVEGVFRDRIKNWTSVQDTWASVLEVPDLYKSILKLTQPIDDDMDRLYPKNSGLYQLKSYDVYFPDFIKSHLDMELPIRTDYPRDMTAAVPLEA